VCAVEDSVVDVLVLDYVLVDVLAADGVHTRSGLVQEEKFRVTNTCDGLV